MDTNKQKIKYSPWNNPKSYFCPEDSQSQKATVKHTTLMRWLNRDPIEEDGGINLYTFCGNIG